MYIVEYQYFKFIYANEINLAQFEENYYQKPNLRLNAIGPLLIAYDPINCFLSTFRIACF
ncbi:hypothetical protein GCM10022216_17950 [Sphingobacterium kyonggiense]|uniref:Uncharacterized protein n=1 Tax=Sphingobacterium kyonggiense TaxID=714075 RepID=A0ABP7YS70_9SPHI